MRGKRNRFKIVSSQKARAVLVEKHERRGTIARSKRCRARGRRNTRRVGIRFSGPAWYHGYYELNEKEVNSVAAKTVDSSGYFQLET